MLNAQISIQKSSLRLTSLDKLRSTAKDRQMLPRIVTNRRPVWHSTEIIAALKCFGSPAVPQISGDRGTPVAGSRNLTATVQLADHQFPLSPLSPLGDLRGDWTGTGSDGAKITLTVSSPDELNGTIVFNYPSGKCVESWSQAAPRFCGSLGQREAPSCQYFGVHDHAIQSDSRRCEFGRQNGARWGIFNGSAALAPYALGWLE